MASRFTLFIPGALALGAIVASGKAQTPINAPGAMQPSTGTGVLHVMPMYRREGADPRTGQQSADNYLALVQVAYGVAKNVGIQFDVPMVYRDVRVGTSGGPSDEFGIADSTLLVKWRIFQDDPAPTETTRFSLIGGVQIPGDSDYTWDASNDALDPIIGGVFSTVRGRHGFNADALWEFYTGDDRDEGASDSLRYDASYLYRLAPAAYTAETQGALYAVAELNGFYDANGDHEIFFSPGIMYEARTFTLDATVMLPLYHDLDHRAETEILIGFGLRLSF
jgi:hypothetical protein